MTTATITKPSTIILNRARKVITLDMTVRDANRIKDARKKAAEFYLAAMGIEVIRTWMRVSNLDTPDDKIVVRRYTDADFHDYTVEEFSKIELEKAF
jgi:hypothetical protein